MYGEQEPTQVNVWVESKTIDHTKIQNKTKNHIKEDFKKKNDSDVPILVNI
jgi:hypothetical protein